jgi:hypothetical protein
MSKSKKQSRKSKAVKSKSQRGPGAPQKPVKWPRGNFTLNKAYALNPDVCKLTIRTRAKKELKKTGTEETAKAGRPSFIYTVRANVVRTQTASPVTVNADGNQTANAVAPVETPAPEVVIAPVIEQAPAIETPAPVEAAVVGGEPVAA